MALTNKSSSSGPLLILKPVSKNKDRKDIEPYYEISEPGPDGKFKARDDKSINTVTGRLVRIEPQEESYEGDTYFRAKIFLRDGEEGYMLATRLNIASRSLINCLFNIQDLDTEISIKYYRSRSGYESFYVSQGGEKIGWKFESDAIPKPTEVPFKGKTIRDFTEVDKFFVEQIEVLNKRIQDNKPSYDTESSDSDQQEEAESEQQDVEEQASVEVAATSPATKRTKKSAQVPANSPF
jgi:hypothetical protein